VCYTVRRNEHGVTSETKKTRSLDEIDERYGEIPVTAKTRHGCETLPSLTLCEKHGAVKFSRNAGVPGNSARSKNLRYRREAARRSVC